MSEEELKYLAELLLKLQRARDTLRYSYEICKGLSEKQAYSEDDRDRFESLTSKFARLSDLIVKQAIKAIDILDLDEPPQTVRDAINRAEKKGIISSAEDFIEIRNLRNKISHEYSDTEEGITLIYRAVLDQVPLLFDSVDRINLYTTKFAPDSRSSEQ